MKRGLLDCQCITCTSVSHVGCTPDVSCETASASSLSLLLAEHVGCCIDVLPDDVTLLLAFNLLLYLREIGQNACLNVGVFLRGVPIYSLC